MSQPISFLLHLLFFLVIAGPSSANNVVNIPMADPDMIQTICRFNDDPAACTNILTSDPQSKTCDLPGLARIAFDHAKTAIKETWDYIHRQYVRTTEPRLHYMFYYCSRRYNYAKGYVVEAMEDLNSGAYSPMIENSVLIGEAAMICEDVFKEAPSRPSPLTDRNKLVYCLGQIGSAVGNILLYPLPPNP
ncbi:hypothetical protein ACLOJK_017766 [Asimina triloba]